MTENKRYVVIIDIDLKVSLKDNITKKYPFSLVCENIDEFEPLLNEVINVCAELNKNWEQTLRFEDYNKKLTQRSIKYEDTIDELKHENKELNTQLTKYIVYYNLNCEYNLLKTEKEQLEKENKELKLQLEAFKDKLCELGVSDVKLYGKRYFKQEWEEAYYIFDSQVISEKEFDKKVEYEDYQAFEDCMHEDDVINRMNKLNDENKEFKHRIERLENYKEASIKFTKEVEDFFERHGFDTVNFDLIDIFFEGFEFYSDKYDELKKQNKELKELIKKTLETTPIEHNLAVELKNNVKEFL